jgi:uncharacterized protein (TIGR02145 family)
MLALVVMGAASVNAQVLIGGTASDEPHSSAILDLASGGQNNLGMLLPNVELDADATAFVPVPDGTEGFETLKQTATGMIVYNIAAVQDGPGLYVWDGSKWTSLGIAPGTPPSNNCPAFIIDERDGNKYFVGDFGAAGCWMTQNMRKTSGLIEGTHYYYPNGSQQNEYEDAHGLLYNWTTASTICPTGWHLPTKREISRLPGEIGADISGKYATETQPGLPGRKMKSTIPVTPEKGDTGGASKGADENGLALILTGYVLLGQPMKYGEEAQTWAEYVNRAIYFTVCKGYVEFQGLWLKSYYDWEYHAVRCVQD